MSKRTKKGRGERRPSGEPGQPVVRDDWQAQLRAWTKENWAQWLTEGFLQCARARREVDFAGAFLPLAIAPRRLDPVISLTADLKALERDPRFFPSRIIGGVELAILNWQPRLGLPVLMDLLHFAEEYPPDGSCLYGRADILDAIAAEEGERRLNAASQMLSTSVRVRWNESDFNTLIGELRTRELWHPTFVGRLLLARAMHASANWRDVFLGELAELKRAFAGVPDEYKLVLESFASIVGLRRIVEAVLVAPIEELSEDGRLATVLRELFCGPSAVIAFADDEPLRLLLLNSEWPNDDSDLAPLFAAHQTLRHYSAVLLIGDLRSRLTQMMKLDLSGDRPEELTRGIRLLQGDRAPFISVIQGKKP
jgi:hypothetical protein